MSIIPGYCSEPDCERPSTRTGRCESHEAAARKEKRNASQPKVAAQPLQRTRIAKVSDKRAEQNAEYSKLREAFLKEHPVCQVCGSAEAEDVHHRAGRSNDLLCEVRYFLAVCRTCHNHIHDDPEFAKQNGYMILRSAPEGLAIDKTTLNQ